MTATARDAESSIYAQLPEMVGNGGTLADRLQRVLQEAIIAGSLPQGMHLKADALSRRYGVSMIPIRESLRTLQATGWVVTEPHRGTFVRRGTETELNDLFEVRSIIETAAGTMAAGHATSQDLQALDEVVAEGFDLVERDELAKFARLNSDFHKLVARAAHNATLLEYQQQLNERVRFYSSILPRERTLSSVKEHAAIVAAIHDRDSQKVHELSAAHISVSRQRVAEELPQPSKVDRPATVIGATARTAGSPNGVR